MRESRLAAGGGNVLQRVRERRAEALARGVRLLDLSIGEPKGPALWSAREAARDAIVSDEESMHAYQYNASPAVPRFSERFVAAQVERPLAEAMDVAFLPIPGIKPMLGLLPLACGCASGALTLGTMTGPGYPIPADWCAFHPLVEHFTLPTSSRNCFRFSVDDVAPSTDLLMLNYPHNPSGQVATREWWRELCEHCARHDIRLFNDAAYCALAYTCESAPLSEVAPDYPDLSWCEAFTGAKLIGNGTGWHVGAVAGSPDFIGDLAEVKGKADTGFVAPMACGVLAAVENDAGSIAEIRERYRRRVERLCHLMQARGMRLANEPKAGFFTLWETPAFAFGEPMADAQAFNFRMIDETGVVGVHFEPYLRYAVCADVETMADALDAAFARARVSYDRAR